MAPPPTFWVYPCSLDPKQELQRKWNNSYLHVAVVSVLDVFFKKWFYLKLKNVKSN